MKLLWFVIAFICGALLPLQAGLNARLGKSIGSPAYASLVFFLVGALSVAIYIPYTKETLNWTGLRSASVYSWIGGGISGAIFITASVLALPRIGMAMTFGLIVAGQVMVAILLDHFNVLVAQQHSINVGRIIGVLLILGGVLMVRKF